MTAPLAIIGQGEYATVIHANDEPPATVEDWREQVLTAAKGIDRLSRRVSTRGNLLLHLVRKHKAEMSIKEVIDMAETTEALLRVLTHYVELVEQEAPE